MPRKFPLCEIGAAVGNSRRPYFWRYINRGCSMCQGCGQDWSRDRIIKMHACLRHRNDWATTTNIINKNKVTRDAVGRLNLTACAWPAKRRPLRHKWRGVFVSPANGAFGTHWATRIFVPPSRQNRSIRHPTGKYQWASGRIFCTPSSPVHMTFTFMAKKTMPEQIF